MLNLKERIQQALELTFPKAKIELVTYDMVHFNLKIVDLSFQGLTLLDQHRSVYRALGELMKECHALSIETLIREE